MSRVIQTTVSILVALSVFAPTTVFGQTSSPQGVVRAADHVGYWEDSHVRWRSRFELRPEVKDEFDRMVLARDYEIVEISPESVTAVRDGEGRVTGLRLPEGQEAPWTITLVVRQPVGDSGRLRPPAAGPRAPHRVTLREAKFTPTGGSVLQEHPGFVSTNAMGRDERQRIESSFGDSPDKADRPVYFRPSDLEGTALPGQAEAVEVHKRRVAWVLGGALALLAGLGLAAYRWLAGRAEEEQAEAILQEHDVELEI